jgi:hypothetical protein
MRRHPQELVLVLDGFMEDAFLALASLFLALRVPASPPTVQVAMLALIHQINPIPTNSICHIFAVCLT